MSRKSLQQNLLALIAFFFILNASTVYAQRDTVSINLPVEKIDSLEKVKKHFQLEYKVVDTIVTDRNVTVPFTFEVATSQFLYWTPFIDYTFKKYTVFYYCDFFGDTYFTDCKFLDEACFVGSVFGKDAFFANIVFEKQVDFSFVSIKKYLTFSETEFKNIAFFEKLRIDKDAEVDFSETLLPDTLDFSRIADVGVVDLSVCNFADSERNSTSEYKRHYINLYKSDISKFHLDYFHFKLLLTDRTKYRNKELEFDEALSVYEGLLKNFKDRGQMLSYEKLDIEYQDYKWQEGKIKLLRWFWVVPHYWNFYGYKKGLVFLYTIGFLILFTMITFIKVDKLAGIVYPMEKIPRLAPIKPYWRSKSIKMLSSRLWYSFVYTASIFFLLSLKVERFNYKHKGGVFYIMLVYSVGLICIAYMANFVIQK